jgi:hypothetical protein
MDIHTIQNFDELAAIINQFDDKYFWKPINSDEKSIQEFNRLFQLVEESQEWEKKRNWEKGKVLEDFAVFIFSRFQGVSIKQNHRPGDNESDVEIHLDEKLRPEFINDYIGPKIICECKNYKSKSIDVGMVSKLAELLPIRGARFGVFISILGIGGYEWRYGEGKRKKILLKEGKPLISFKFSELKQLRQGENFLTMIKQKVRALYDEVDDDSPDVPPIGHIEYTKRMLEVLEHMKKCDILNDEETQEYNDRIISLYGNPLS